MNISINIYFEIALTDIPLEYKIYKIILILIKFEIAYFSMPRGLNSISFQKIFLSILKRYQFCVCNVIHLPTQFIFGSSFIISLFRLTFFAFYGHVPFDTYLIVENIKCAVIV